MLALLFSIGPERYAIPARAVVEVVPRVAVRPLQSAPAWLCGMFAYRGEVVPVVDLCMRLLGSSCPERVSSRIVVVEREGVGAGARWGMLAERVTEVRRLGETSTRPRLAEAPLVAGTVLDQGTLIQLLDLDAALPSDASFPNPASG